MNKPTHVALRSLVFKLSKDELHLQDTDDKWKAIQKLLDSQDFNHLLKNINGFIAIYNFSKGHYEYFSEGIKANLGFAPQNFVGEEHVSNVFSLMYPGHTQHFLKIMENVLTYLSIHTTPEDGIKYRFNCSIKLSNHQSVYQWYLLDTIILQTDLRGFPLRSMITCTNISSYKTDENVIYNILKKDLDECYNVVHDGIISSEKTDNTLTKREAEILSLIANGWTNHKISEKLFISSDTVKAHRRNILSKTNCKGIAQLTQYALVHGLL